MLARMYDQPLGSHLLAKLWLLLRLHRSSIPVLPRLMARAALRSGEQYVELGPEEAVALCMAGVAARTWTAYSIAFELPDWI